MKKIKKQVYFRTLRHSSFLFPSVMEPFTEKAVFWAILLYIKWSECLCVPGPNAEVVEEFAMSKCCYDNTGITHVNSTDIVLEPATCSYRYCKGKRWLEHDKLNFVPWNLVSFEVWAFGFDFSTQVHTNWLLYNSDPMIHQIQNYFSAVDYPQTKKSFSWMNKIKFIYLFFIANDEVITRNYPTEPYGQAYWNSVREVKVDFKGKFNKQNFVWILV